MAQTDKIWVGPGVLRAVPGFKGEKVVQPGHAIPKGFVSSDRIKQLEKRDKICSESAYTKSQAASGVVPVIDAAGKIKALEANVRMLDDAGKELAVENKKLTEIIAASTDEATAIMIEELEKKIGQLEETDKAQKTEIKSLDKALKEAIKKGDK